MKLVYGPVSLVLVMDESIPKNFIDIPVDFIIR